jgi:hypothetical protein
VPRARRQTADAKFVISHRSGGGSVHSRGTQ